jgi:hypothetical protein
MGVYSNLEDKWYATLDRVDKVVPVYKIIDPVDKVIPSFILFLIILIIIILFLVSFSFSLFTVDNSIDIIAISASGVPLSDVKISLQDSCGENSLLTDNSGKVKTIVCEGEVKLVANKNGYGDFSQVYFEEDYLESGRIAIKLSQITLSEKTFTALVTDATNDLIKSSKLELICSGDTKAEMINQTNDGFVFYLSQNSLGEVSDIYGQFTTDTKIYDCSNLQLKASADGYEDKLVNVLTNDERINIKLDQLIKKGTVLFYSTLDFEDLGDIEINLTNQASETLVVETDSSGSYLTELNEGTYNYVASYGGDYVEGEFVLEQGDNKKINLLFISTTAVTNDRFVNLFVVDESDNGVVGAKVSIFKNSSKIPKTTNTLGKTSPLKVREKELENTVFKGVIKKPGYEIKLFDIVLQEQGQYQKVVVSQGGGKLNLLVIDDLNNFEKNASIKLLLKDTNYVLDTVRTDGNGEAKIQNLPALQMDVIAQDYSNNDSKKETITFTKDEEKSMVIQLDTGEGKIEFTVLNKDGDKVNVNYKLYVKENEEYVLAGEGFDDRITTSLLKVKTKVKLVVVDGNYFVHESIVYPVQRSVQKKSVFVRAQDSLQNSNVVQMFLSKVYETNPLYSSAKAATRILDGEEYYLHFLIVLDEVDVDSFVSDFVIDSNKEIFFGGADSIEGSYSVMVGESVGGFVDSANDDLVDVRGKQLGAFFGASQKVSVPIIVKLVVDENVSGSFKILFRSNAGGDSLEYFKEFVIGERFCFEGVNCPVFMFSNFVRNNVSGVTVPLVENHVVFLEDDYSVVSRVHNLSDQDFGGTNFVFNVPKSKLRYATFGGDANSVSRDVVLGPLGVSGLVEVDLDFVLPTRGFLFKQTIEDQTSAGLFRNYVGNGESVGLVIKNKNVLALDVSPRRIDKEVVYPMFLVKTRFTSSSAGVSAFWKAEKVVGGQSSLLYSGETDGNGLQRVSFSSLNLDAGDVVLFTVWDNNGSIEGTKEVIVTDPFPPAVGVAPSCLGIWHNTEQVLVNDFVVSGNVGDSKDFVIKSDCDFNVEVSFVSDLSLSVLDLVVPALGQSSFSVVGNPLGGVLGVYPVEFFSNEFGVRKLLNVDFVLSDSNSCFDLEQAVFDLRTVGELSSKVTNKCVSGRLNNFYPKMNLGTESTYVNFDKPGNPRYIDFNTTVIGSGLEGYFQSTVGATIIRFEQHDICSHDDPRATFYNYPASSVSGLVCQEVHEAVKTAHSYAGDTTPMPEPDLNINNPRVALGRMPRPSDWASAPSMDSYGSTTGTVQSATTLSNTYKTTYPYFPRTGDFGQSGGIGSVEDIPLNMRTELTEGGGFDRTCDTGDTYCINKPYLSGNKAYYVGWPIYFTANGISEGRATSGRVLPADPRYGLAMFNGRNYISSNEQQYDYASSERWYENAPLWLGLEEAGSGCYKVTSSSGNGNHKTSKFTEYKYLGNGISYLEWYLHGDQSYTDSGSICHQNTAVFQAQFETTRGSELLFERKAKWTQEVRLNTVEGIVENLGTYSEATPVTQLEDITASSDGYGEWSGYAGTKVYYFTGAAHPNGMVDLQRAFFVSGSGAYGCVVGDTVCEQQMQADETWFSFPGNCPTGNESVCSFQQFIIRPPEDPLVEYSNDGKIMYYIPQDTIPGYVEGNPEVRTFLRDGRYYAEYIGVPEIAGNNIDFNLIKNDLLGDEYAILEVSDWISDDDVETQKFRIKLKGQEHLCFNGDDEGYTGSDFIPRINYDWEWSAISLDECDSENGGYAYCDGTQFTASLFKKLNGIQNLLKAGHITSVPQKTTFYSYLIKDNYNSSFLADFKSFYANTFAEAEVNYLELFKFIEDDGLVFKVNRGSETVLPYGGLFRVEIDINFVDESVMSLFDGGEINALIVVNLSQVYKAPNYNVLFEMPFDGLLGSGERDGYGLSVSGETIKIDSGFSTSEYTNALTEYEATTSTNSNLLNNEIVLILDSVTNKIVFMPSQPTPVLLKVDNDSFSNLSVGYKLDGVTGITNPSKEWKLVGSNMGGSQCADFSGLSKTIFEDVPSSGNVNSLSWVDPNVGRIILASVFFTPKGSGTTTIVPTNLDKSGVKSFGYLNNPPKAFLNNFESQDIVDFDTLSWVFDGVATEKMCISKDTNEFLKIWWNQEYLNQLIDDVSQGERTNCQYG